ncbi:MAG: hypothetical protein ACN6OP_13535 [Pseudomonadales bacterium]
MHDCLRVILDFYCREMGIDLADGVLNTELQHFPAPGSILHPLNNRDSERDTYGGYWHEVTVSYWHHLASDSTNTS